MTIKPDSISPENASEFLRLSLPLMSRHKIPATPENYAVWFSYVAGEDASLREEIDKLIADKAVFTDEVNRSLFLRYASECDVMQFQKIRNEMGEILQDVGKSLISAGQNAASYGGTLDGLVSNVQTTTSLDDIRDLLGELVEETRSMQKSNQLLREHFESKTREIDLLLEELERERKRATTDPLTGLSNRTALFEALEALIAEHKPNQAPSLLMVDIDHFKRINDNYGHLIGDRVIRFVARVLKQNTKGLDLAARYGGEEFAVVLPNTPLVGAKTVAETIRRTIADASLVRSDTKEPLGQVTVSIGIARYAAGENQMEFVNRADQALYRSKHTGRNKVTMENEMVGIKKA